MKKTIIDLFESSVEKYGAKTFLLEKKHRAFEPTTYAETKELALETGAGLAAIGIRPKDKVAILAEGSNAWIVSELGMFYAGAVSVPLSVKLEESNDLLFRMRHAEVKALFVSKYQLPKIRRIRAELPEVKHIIVIGHIPRAKPRWERSAGWAATICRSTARSSSPSGGGSGTTTMRRSPTRRAPRPTPRASC